MERMKTLNTTELDNLRLRVRETMKNTIGEVYDNETLVFINTEGKASASIRLYQHRGYDSLGTMILSPSKDGGMGPLQLRSCTRYTIRKTRCWTERSTRRTGIS